MLKKIYSLNLFFILVITIFLYTPVIEAAIRVEPSRFIFIAEQGTTNTGSIKIYNKGDKELTLKAFLYDWTIDDNGEVLTSAPGSRESTLEGFIKFNPRQFTIPPDSFQIVRFTVRTDLPQEGERRGIVFFEHTAPLLETETEALVKTQIGTTLYVIPARTDFRFDLVKSVIDSDEDGKKHAFLLVRNQGNAHIRFYPTYKIIAENGSLIEEGHLKEKVVLPDKLMVVDIPFKEDLTPGKYNLQLKITFYAVNSVMEHTEPFEVK